MSLYNNTSLNKVIIAIILWLFCIILIIYPFFFIFILSERAVCLLIDSQNTNILLFYLKIYDPMESLPWPRRRLFSLTEGSCLSCPWLLVFSIIIFLTIISVHNSVEWAKAKNWYSHSDLHGVSSIPAIPFARNVPLLLWHELFNEASLPAKWVLDLPGLYIKIPHLNFM